MPNLSQGISPGPGFLAASFTEFESSLGNNLSGINLPQDSELDMSTFSQTSQRSETNTSFDVKKFSSRLMSHMSTISDGLPFSDIEDVDELDQTNAENTPFSKPPVKSNLVDLRQKHTSLDDGALFLPPTSSAPRSVTPKPNGTDSGFEGSLCDNSQEITPTKPILAELDPLTPTANLKVLLSAASPEIRNRERQKLNETGEFDTSDLAFGSNSLGEFPVPNDDEIEAFCERARVKNVKPGRVRKKPKKLCSELDHVAAPLPEPVAVISRKEKSLGLLCQRFLALYPEMPDPNSRSYICLDAVAAHLNVERRRIYDIVNVLESVDMVSRVAKNKYAWHGKSNLINTLYRLKMVGIEENLAKQLEHVERANQTATPAKKSPNKSKRTDGPNHDPEISRKDKSLGLLSEKFLSLFLVSLPPRIINLDLSAKILLGDPFGNKTETGKFKTKIRRLYDIANILTSLALIQKVHVTETRGRKPAFQYIGPEPETLMPSQGTDLSRRLHVIPKEPLQRLYGPTKRVLVVEPRKVQAKPKQTTMKRHSSLEQICRVAEGERERLNSESKAAREDTMSTSFEARNSAIYRSQVSHQPLCVPPSAILDTNPVSIKQEQPQQKLIKTSKSAPEPSTDSHVTTPPAAQQTSVVTLNNDQLDKLIQQLGHTPSGSIEVNNDNGQKSQMKISGALLEALKKARNSSKAASSLAPSSSNDDANVVRQIRLSTRKSAPQLINIVNRPGTASSGGAVKREMIAQGHTSPKIAKTEMGVPQPNDVPVTSGGIASQLLKPPVREIKTEKTSNDDRNGHQQPKFGYSPLRPLSLGDPYQHMPRVPSMDIGLPSPLPTSSQGSSGLNTPTLPSQSAGPSDDNKTEQQPNSTDVFTFPLPPPSESQRTARSLPTTPTIHLSTVSSSPIMILPAKTLATSSTGTPTSLSTTGNSTVFLTPQSGSGSQGFLTPHQNYVSPGFLTPQNGPTGLITPGSGAYMLCSPTMSPLAPFTSTPTAQFLLPNGVMFTPTELQKEQNVFSITPTLPNSGDKVPFNITPLSIRPSSGIAPSSGKIVNLMPLFSTPPAQIISNDVSNASPIETSSVCSPTEGLSASQTNKSALGQIIPTSQSPSIEVINQPNHDQGIIKSELKENLPQCNKPLPARPTLPVPMDTTVKTPTLRKIKEVATPGTFFRGTPQQDNVKSNGTSSGVCFKSAFNVVTGSKTEKVLVQSNIPARRLALADD